MFTIRLYLWILNLNFILVSGHTQKYIHFTFFPQLFKNMDFPGSSAGKESACNAGNLGSVSGVG